MFTTNLFQFHKGTIRTELRKLSPPLKTNFNSIKVRLERTTVIKRFTADDISIP